MYGVASEQKGEKREVETTSKANGRAGIDRVREGERPEKTVMDMEKGKQEHARGQKRSSRLGFLPLDESINGGGPCGERAIDETEPTRDAPRTLTGIVLAPARQVRLDRLAKLEQLGPDIDRDRLERRPLRLTDARRDSSTPRVLVGVR